MMATKATAAATTTATAATTTTTATATAAAAAVAAARTAYGGALVGFSSSGAAVTNYNKRRQLRRPRRFVLRARFIERRKKKKPRGKNDARRITLRAKRILTFISVVIVSNCATRSRSTRVPIANVSRRLTTKKTHSDRTRLDCSVRPLTSPLQPPPPPPPSPLQPPPCAAAVADARRDSRPNGPAMLARRVATAAYANLSERRARTRRHKLLGGRFNAKLRRRPSHTNMVSVDKKKTSERANERQFANQG